MSENFDWGILLRPMYQKDGSILAEDLYRAIKARLIEDLRADHDSLMGYAVLKDLSK